MLVVKENQMRNFVERNICNVSTHSKKAPSCYLTGTNIEELPLKKIAEKSS